MKMFLGEYNPNLTEGSRLALPKKMREQIASDQVVLTKGFEKCVYIFDKEDWSEQAIKQIENSSIEGQGKIRDLERYIYTSAVESNVDAQGRFVVPSSLTDYAEISDSTTIVGVGNRIEVWSKNNWEEYKHKISAALSN